MDEFSIGWKFLPDTLFTRDRAIFSLCAHWTLNGKTSEFSHGYSCYVWIEILITGFAQTWKVLEFRGSTTYRLRGEGLNLKLLNFNLKFKKNSFTYSWTKLWNSLPFQVRLSSDANDFRSRLHDCSFQLFLERVL